MYFGEQEKHLHLRSFSASTIHIVDIVDGSLMLPHLRSGQTAVSTPFGYATLCQGTRWWLAPPLRYGVLRESHPARRYQNSRDLPAVRQGLFFTEDGDVILTRRLLDSATYVAEVGDARLWLARLKAQSYGSA